ncbi:PREDICTED: uncharacterized protein LOC109170283 [Ipomoea nil]|uniref:uncharacterized protein LOC109170283 n=1 Tax=Ipomoea nil TaxID=35883 RepID=UPI000901CB78|nr:PREDICTED: uncharacterized protein LOC109170283 [Ipomoea nil]
MTGAHNIGSVAGVMGVTRSEFEALKESVNELKLLQCITKFLNQTPKIDTPTSLGSQQTDGDVTSLNVDDSSFTIIVDHPHVEIAPMQATVSADQPHVVSTQKAAEIEIVPFPKTVLCVGGLFHLSPTPSHLRVVSYGIGQSSSLVSPSSSHVVVPNNSFKGCPSLGSSSPLFAPPLISRMPLKAFPFALLLVRPFDRGKCWLRDAQSYQA